MRPIHYLQESTGFDLTWNPACTLTTAEERAEIFLLGAWERASLRIPSKKEGFWEYIDTEVCFVGSKGYYKDPESGQIMRM